MLRWILVGIIFSPKKTGRGFNPLPVLFFF
nr:MAG TPA: hypothetical protein [Caudoviricetes sp.]